MPVIKKCFVPMLLMLAGSAVVLHFGHGSSQALTMSLAVILPSVLVLVWKLFSVMRTEIRSAESWVMAALMLAVGLFLALIALNEIGAQQIII